MKAPKYIYFASSNKDKLKEIKSILLAEKVKNIQIKLPERRFSVKEDGESFLENAFKKAQLLSKKLKSIVFAEDSGIEVSEMGGKPGIKSARYFRGGKGMLKIIARLKNKPNKKCCFTCALVVTDSKGKIIFKTQKSWFGEVASKPVGKNGFGYDPIFLVPGLRKTSAQIDTKLKNRLSHRAMATRDFAKWLKKSYRKLTR